MNFNSGSYFNDITAKAQDLIAREQKPGFKPTDVDFSTVVACSFCQNHIMGKKLSCSACKAPIYCSKEVRRGIIASGIYIDIQEMRSVQ